MILYFAWEWWFKNYNNVDNLLQSYFSLCKHTDEKNNAIFSWRKNFLLDSGAYSAFTQKKPVDIKSYIKFIKKNMHQITTYANLDSIWDAKQTRENQKLMEESGLNPLPTYHEWSDIYWFEKYVSEYEYVWLWGMVWTWQWKKSLKNFLDYCFYYIKKNWLKTKIHWRGMTTTELVLRYPFFSIDSTSRLSSIRYNNYKVFENGKMRWFSATDYRKRFWIDWWTQSLSKKLEINYIAYKNLEKYVTKLHKTQWLIYWE